MPPSPCGRPPPSPPRRAGCRGAASSSPSSQRCSRSAASPPPPPRPPPPASRSPSSWGPPGPSPAPTSASARGYAAQARSYGATVVEVYTPNATWARVRSAVQGANLLIYLGHGNGFPSPYISTLNPLKMDGFGLNGYLGQRQHPHHLLRRVLRPHPGQAGPQRGRDPQPPLLLGRQLRARARRTPRLSVARRRVDNFGAGLPPDGREGRSSRRRWATPPTSSAASSRRTRRCSRSSGAPRTGRGPTGARSPRCGRPG